MGYEESYHSANYRSAVLINRSSFIRFLPPELAIMTIDLPSCAVSLIFSIFFKRWGPSLERVYVSRHVRKGTRKVGHCDWDINRWKQNSIVKWPLNWCLYSSLIVSNTNLGFQLQSIVQYHQGQEFFCWSRRITRKLVNDSRNPTDFIRLSHYNCNTKTSHTHTQHNRINCNVILSLSWTKEWTRWWERTG